MGHYRCASTIMIFNGINLPFKKVQYCTLGESTCEEIRLVIWETCKLNITASLIHRDPWSHGLHFSLFFNVFSYLSSVFLLYFQGLQWINIISKTNLTIQTVCINLVMLQPLTTMLCHMIPRQTVTRRVESSSHSRTKLSGCFHHFSNHEENRTKPSNVGFVTG